MKTQLIGTARTPGLSVPPLNTKILLACLAVASMAIPTIAGKPSSSRGMRVAAARQEVAAILSLAVPGRGWNLPADRPHHRCRDHAKGRLRSDV